mgnify:CR=1 FL=1
MNKLEQLKAMTAVVADTGDIEAIAAYQPEDATTNPSLLLKAAQLPAYQGLIQTCIASSGLKESCQSAQVEECMDQLLVALAKEILAIVPGRVSLEVDARLSFCTEQTLARARSLVTKLQAQGIGKERFLIKIASTWEGIQAARELEKEGVHCNLTLLFGFAQAVACAQAGVFLISPFVGRILDWHKANSDQQSYLPAEDPGVKSVKRIFEYYKQHGYPTHVMGASFRNLQEIEELAGCDKLTISPALLEELAQSEGDLPIKLKRELILERQERVTFTEAEFRWSMNQDAMATEKLSEGIRNFAADQVKLESLLISLASTAQREREAS